MAALEPPASRSVFTEPELTYLHGQRRLARIATIGRDGTPHVVPSGFTHNPELDTIGGRAEAISAPQAIIRIHPARIISWGLGPGRSARTVGRSGDD